MLFRNCYDVDAVDEDSDSDDYNSKKQKAKLPSGPLMLEQYEAQVQSVIASCLTDRAQSMLYMDDICRMIELFLGLNICQDEHLSKTIMQSLFGNLAIEPLQKQDMSFVSLSQVAPEGLCLNSTLLKMRLVGKIQVMRTQTLLQQRAFGRKINIKQAGIDMAKEKHYITKMNEFLTQYLNCV